MPLLSLLSLSLLVTLATSLPLSSSLRAGGIERVDVFSAGEGGYFCIKIPTLLRTKNNVLIAMGEARMDTCSDFAHTDLVTKRSFDNGTTWTALSVLYSNSSATEKNVIGNAAPVQLSASGRILLPFCRNNHETWLTYSDDDGATWVTPRVIPEGTMPNWRWIGLGPPAGLELESGRVVIPAYHETLAHEDGTFTKGHTMISDDQGLTWHLGKTFGGIHFPNECQAVDLGYNTLLLNARGIGTRRLSALSRDGGETFEDLKVISSLPETWDGCEGSMIKLQRSRLVSRTGENNNNFSLLKNGEILLFSNPHSGGLYRKNMTLLGSDDGETWKECRQIDSGSSGYSALTEMADGSVSILYERSATLQTIFTPDHISFERVWYPGCNTLCGCEN